MHDGTSTHQLQMLNTPELLAEVFEHLEPFRDRQTLNNAGLVSHAWRTEALKILWRLVSIRHILRLLGLEGPLKLDGAVS